MSITQNMEVSEIQKGINLLGLKISEYELNQLQSRNSISLEGRGLSEIGSVFILAEALWAVNSVKSITFADLPKLATETSRCSGIPLYCWNCDIFGKSCILLTLVDGKPTIKVSS